MPIFFNNVHLYYLQLCENLGEDRRVKKAMKAGFNAGIYSEWSREVVRASYEERRNNPRSKCAKLRWAVLAGEPRI